jgi:ATP/ADP translocase
MGVFILFFVLFALVLIGHKQVFQILLEFIQKGKINLRARRKA